MFSEDIFTFLQTQAAVTDLVGEKIRPDMVDVDDALPYIVYQMVSTDRDSTFEKVGGFVMRRYQFECYSTDYTEAQLMAATVLSVLEGSPAFPTFDVHHALQVDERSGPPSEQRSHETGGAYRSDVEIEFAYTDPGV